MAIYACLWGIYAYCKPCKHIYMAYIYVCHVCLYAFMPFACYMCANGCKLVQMYAPLHINAPPNEESRPRLSAAKLSEILGAKVDQALCQWLD